MTVLQAAKYSARGLRLLERRAQPSLAINRTILQIPRTSYFSTAGMPGAETDGTPHQTDLPSLDGSHGGGGRGRGGRGRGGRGNGGYLGFERGGYRREGRSGYQVAHRAEGGAGAGAGQAAGVRSQDHLKSILSGLNKEPYGMYRVLEGSYLCTHPAEKVQYTLYIDRVQSDSFAPPSSFRVKISTSDAGIPEDTYNSRIKKTAFCDYVTRHVQKYINNRGFDIGEVNKSWSGPRGGNFNINYPSQQVLERTSCMVQQASNTADIELRFTLNLPGRGRTILGKVAEELILTRIPALVENGLLWKSYNSDVWDHIRSVQVQDSLRGSLKEYNLVAFVGNSSILPRVSGASPYPMDKEQAVAFESPESLKVRIETDVLDSTGSKITVEGMGIPCGITVLTGGGFHGKTTLLEALEFGVYNVIPGDGRELVVTDINAFKIRAEDGRNVVETDISPFINNLPGPNRATTRFTSTDASGSTSMAANIQEAIEIGATTLLIDEDTSATNFLVRDQRMQELIKSEPISPFVSKARGLFEERDVSTIIIIGGCGDYLTIADTVIGMETYRAFDMTSRAREIVQQFPVTVDQDPEYGTVHNRIPILPEFHMLAKSPRAQGMWSITRKDRESEAVDLSGIDQLVEEGQTNACAEVLSFMPKLGLHCSFKQWAKYLKNIMDEGGLDALRGGNIAGGKLVRPRELEILSAINRVRGLVVIQGGLL